MDNSIYMYPMRNVADLKAKNPYVFHLCSGLLCSFKIVNYGKDITGGVLDVIKYFSKCSKLYFNWVESMPLTQVPFFLLIFLISKIFGKRVIWTHHNVHPHKTNNIVSRFVIQLLIRYADFVVIHTRESLPLLTSRRNKDSIIYFFHPFFTEKLFTGTEVSDDKEFDLLIWGNVRKSKGVEGFLDYLKETNQLNRYKIKVIGKFESLEYYNAINQDYQSPNLYIENGFIGSDELQKYHQKSRFIFFPYTGSSVLNSGAVITSLPYNVPIIGPNVGAFKELGQLGYIYTYKSFSDVFKYLETNNIEDSIAHESLHAFIQDHTWQKFGKYLKKHL